MREATKEPVLLREETLDIFLAKIELNAALLKHGEHPVIGLENLRLFQATSGLFKQLPQNHPLRRKYDIVKINTDLAKIVKYYVGIEAAYYLSEAKSETA